MDAFKCRLDVQWTALVDESGKTGESLQLRWHYVEERCCQDVHALHVGELEISSAFEKDKLLKSASRVPPALSRCY
jgi:hypothetical protein